MVFLPQVAETHIPQPVDVAGECLLYYGYIIFIKWDGGR
jgi:hypothetical protein